MENAELLQAMQKMMETQLEPINNRLTQIEGRLTQLEVTIENETNTKINLMYESHQGIIQKLNKADEIDEVKGRVSTLETVVQIHSEDILQLKKAN